MLIIDHNVCRFHTFDLFRWILFRDTKTGNKEHFGSLRKEFWSLVDGSMSIGDQILFYKEYADKVSPHAFFNDDPLGTMTAENHENELNQMFMDPEAKEIPTDLNCRLDPIFYRRDVTGYLLRYRSDPNIPTYVDNLVVYESDHVLNLELECKIIIKNRINAILLSSTDQAIMLTDRLQKQGYKDHITFIIGRYGYNFEYNDEGKPYYPKYNLLLGQMELDYGHEYGYFDPYTGLSSHREEARSLRDAKPIVHDDLPNVAALPGIAQ